MTLANYLMKGAAYGGATGAAMGVVDDDIGIFGGAATGVGFGLLAGAAGPAYRNFLNKSLNTAKNQMIASGNADPNMLKLLNDGINTASMPSAIHRGALIGGAAGMGVGMTSDDTSVIGGKFMGAAIGAGLGFARNKGMLSLNLLSKKTGTGNNPLNAIVP